jgi:3-hydroxyacyl-CoA dehydrogenase
MNPFERVALVGSGILGTQIAMMAAYAGYSVKLYDANKDAFTDVYNTIERDLKAKQSNPLHTLGGLGKMQAVHTTTASFDEAVKDADLVIEVVPEVVDL